MFAGHKRVVGMITTARLKEATDLIDRGLADQYTGEYPPRGKRKINLKDLK
jgi:hypothetical protein